MIIKTAEDKQPHLNALQKLLKHPDADTATRKRIEQEIRNIRAGIRGEEEAAYEMVVHYGESKNWIVLHDLRIEHNNLVAQIDHLLINRWLDMWVCESKNFSEGIAINEYGEFSAFFGGKPYGVPSPIEQNNKHILILQRVIESRSVDLPKRLGFTITPNLRSLVLVSKNARITRPKAKSKDLDCIIKNDQLFKTVNKYVEDKNVNPLLIARIVSQETLESLGREICGLHKPILFNWSARFGLPEYPAEILKLSSIPTQSPVEELHHSSQPQSISIVTTECPSKNPTKPEGSEKSRNKLICNSCGKPITYNVAKFCWFNKARFGENLYCMDCQKKI